MNQLPDVPVGKMLLTIAAVGFSVGAVVTWAAPKVWAWVKPCIHAGTA